VAGVLLFDKYYGVVYNCDTCQDQDKKTRGCKDENPDAKMWVDCLCNKHDEACKICNGGGMIRLIRCPRSVFGNRKVSNIIPYFNEWLNSNHMAYPDGRGRYYQSIKLVHAFNVLLGVYNRTRGEK
jgi:hypothetical protein